MLFNMDFVLQATRWKNSIAKQETSYSVVFKKNECLRYLFVKWGRSHFMFYGEEKNVDKMSLIQISINIINIIKW